MGIVRGGPIYQAENVVSYGQVYDPGTLSWVAAQQALLNSSSVTIAGTITAAQGAGSSLAWAVSGPLTNAELRSSALSVTGTFYPSTQAVSGPLTNTELRASAVSVIAGSTEAWPVSGTFWPSTQAVSGPLTNEQFRASAVSVVAGSTATWPVSGIVAVSSGVVLALPASTAASTVVNASTSSVTLAAANVNRHGASLFNPSTASVYVILGPTASTALYTLRLDGSGFYETPGRYTGAVAGIWASTVGSVMVTELVS